MKIEKCDRFIGHLVQTDDGRSFTRYGSLSWTERMGESDEPVHECAELETLYQQWANLPSRGEGKIVA